MKQVTLKEVKKGDFFILTENPKTDEEGNVLEKYVYIKDEYERSGKKGYWWTHKFTDVNSNRLMKGDKKVWIEFIF